MLGIAAGMAIRATLSGETLAVRFGHPPGPVIIVVAGILFLASIPVRRGG